MAAFLIDGAPIPFEEGDNVLAAALKAGVEIPYFCYHEALGSLGACRLCAVKIAPEKPDGRPRVAISCMEPAREGMEVSIDAEGAAAARRGVIEALMTGHPHDCPVCDEGGECHLQEMTVACGPPYRRYRGPKRTFPNQDLGPLVHHEMNRCITCYRCTRFYRDYALGDDLGAMRTRNEVYFGRFRDGPLESPFAGNLAEICPTGVFTDRVFRSRFARTWDLDTAPAVCPHCSVGCNTLPGARHGTLRRVRARAHPEINRWFICDRGRYGHAHAEHPERPLAPRVDGRPASHAEALAAAAERIGERARLAALGSPREDQESNALLRALAPGRFAAFADPRLRAACVRAVNAMRACGAPALADMEAADAILVAGDLTGHAPMMDLALRQAIRHGAPLFVAATTPAPLEHFAAWRLTVAPDEQSPLLARLASEPAGGEAEIAEALRAARAPLLAGVAETLGAAGVAALAGLAEEVGAKLALALPGANAYGTALLSAPGDTERVLTGIEAGEIRALVVAGNDPLDEPGTGARWRDAVARLDTLVVLDCLDTATARAADILLPVAAHAERDGTFVNYEGRAQGYARVFRRDAPLPAPASLLTELGAGAPEAAMAALPGLRTPPAGGAGEFTAHDPLPEGELPDPPAPGAWRAALERWYGEDPLSMRAPALASLAPAACARIHPDSARGAGVEPGTPLRLTGPAGGLELPAALDAAVAPGCVGLSRASLARLGAGHGDALELESEP